jgi:dimethylamine/trimethylamine dehydrogenase
MPNVDIFPDNNLNAEDALSIGAEHIVVATGSKWRADGFGRYHSEACLDLGPGDQLFTPNDIFKGRLPQGKVLIFDDDHYYLGGVLAEALAKQGVEVCFVTPENLVSAWGVMIDEQYQAQQRLLHLGVQIITAHGLDHFDGANAHLGCVYTERTQVVAADAILLVTARTPSDHLYHELAVQIDSDFPGSAPSLTKIGDCDAPAIIAAAIYAGHRYARELEADVKESDVRWSE